MPSKVSYLALAIMIATAAQASETTTSETSTYKAITSEPGSSAVEASQATMLEKVTVSATRSEKQLKDVAGSVAVVDSEAIEKQLATGIADLVRYEPGIIAGNDGRTGTKGFNIRGMDGNRVKIMVDGVDQPQQLDSGFTYQRSQRNFVDTDSLKAVEIVKGPSSSLYGSDAIGGIVAYQTKDPADYLNAEGDDTAGSLKGGYTSANKGFSQTATIANRSGNVESLLVYTHRDSKETATHGGPDTTGPSRGAADPQDNSSDNLLAKVQFQLNEQHRLNLSGEYLNSDSDIELKSGDNLLPPQTTGEDQVSRHRLGIEHEWQANMQLFDSSTLALDWQKSRTHQQTFVPPVSGFPSYNRRTKDYLYEEELVKLSGQFDKSLSYANMKHDVIYGFDISDTNTTNHNVTHEEGKETIVDNYIPGVKSRTYGLYLQDDIHVTPRLTVTPGIRYDRFAYSPSQNNGFQTPVEDTSDGKATGRLGAVYKLTDQHSAFAQFSQGFKAPGYREMYFSKDNQLHGYKQLSNPDLKPEESNSLELGLRGSGHLGSYEVASFYNRYDNFIENRTHNDDPKYPNGVSRYENIAKAEIKGLELRGELWLDDAMDAPSGSYFKGSLSYATGEDKISGEQLQSIAPLTAVMGLGYDDLSDTWGGELTWTLVKGKDDDDVTEGNFNPAGYGLVDMTAYYKPSRDVTLRGGLFNAGNKKYYQWDDVRNIDANDVSLARHTQPGRNVSLSAIYSF